MLDIFKQEKSFLTRAKEKSSFKYRIVFDNRGAFVEICDAKLKPIKEIDYRVYNGLDREILKAIENSKEEDFFQISWESENSNIYLDEHPRILELLRTSTKLIDGDGKSLEFSDGVK
ncbi:MAG: hypothetical protein U9R50_05620, partial [Campylobacterota bacterium]|nr:hypothetical protein [Campylobacterota bacterium]